MKLLKFSMELLKLLKYWVDGIIEIIQNLDRIYCFYLLIFFKILIIYINGVIDSTVGPTSEPWIGNFFDSMIGPVMKTLDKTVK